MERLPEPLTTFRQFVEADLRRAARLIIGVQDELDPQVRMAAADGDYLVTVTLPPGTTERQRLFRRLSNFMAWKQSPSFTLACELSEPDSVYALGVSHKEVHACASLIQREPRPWTKHNFGSVEWLPRDAIGQEMIDLLPRGTRSFTSRDLEELEAWFGVAGKFPAVHIASGEVKGL